MLRKLKKKLKKELLKIEIRRGEFADGYFNVRDYRVIVREGYEDNSKYGYRYNKYIEAVTPYMFEYFMRNNDKRTVPVKVL